MKRLLFLICSISLTCNIFALEQDTIRPDDYYKSQMYEEAIEGYLNIVNDNKESSELYYNLGNAYFKSSNLPKAILYYEKALLLNPNDKDIQYNLAFAYSQQPDNIEHLSLGFLPRIFQKLYRQMQVDTWAIWGIIFFILFGISICVFLFSQILTRKKIAVATLFCSLLFGIVSICCANSRHNELTKHEYAIVIEPTTSIKTEPMITAMDLATIHGGIKVKVLEKAFGWLKVELGNGKEGWILNDLVERI